ncbi:MAG: DUF2277 domain-containing protein [Actinobacteria bacterium]|nr:DUF2277 domain-containing protein [Actinomycetota bacterium]
MCRNITTLRGLEPPATAEEVEAAARQFVRKISGVTRPSAATRAPIEKAVSDVAAAATALLAELPARRQPPATVPPLRRPQVQARLARREESPVHG